MTIIHSLLNSRIICSLYLFGITDKSFIIINNNNNNINNNHIIIIIALYNNNNNNTNNNNNNNNLFAERESGSIQQHILFRVNKIFTTGSLFPRAKP